jgi:hypothetical protein
LFDSSQLLADWEQWKAKHPSRGTLFRRATSTPKSGWSDSGATASLIASLFRMPLVAMGWRGCSQG